MSKKNVKNLVGLVLGLTVLITGCQKQSGFNISNNVNVLSREDGSGTRGAFIELFGIEKKNTEGKKIDYTTEEAQITNSTSVMMTTISSDKYSIGYVSLGFINNSVKALKINEVIPSIENIQNGQYKIVRPFNIVTSKNEVLSISANDFINYILSKQGQEIVEKNGFIPIATDKEYTSKINNFEKVVVAGSSSVTPVMEKIKEAYLLKNPQANIEIQQSDSTTGITSTINQICDIGMASRDLKASEIEKAQSTVIAQDGIAIIVNLENPITDMTTEMVSDIYTGKITKWNSIIEN